MYINYKYLYSKELDEKDLDFLFKVHQKEDLLLENSMPLIDKFINLEVVSFNKAGKVRMTKKGSVLLNNITTAKITEGTDALLERLVELYIDAGKDVGTLLEMRKRLLWFQNKTGFTDELIFRGVKSYLEWMRGNEALPNQNNYKYGVDGVKYAKRLDNLFWLQKPGDWYANYTIEKSPLYDYICKKWGINQIFLAKKRGVQVEWMMNVSNLKVPSKGPFFTGTRKGDQEAIKRIKEEYKKLIKL